MAFRRRQRQPVARRIEAGDQAMQPEWAHWDSNPEPKDSSLRTFRCSLDYVFTHGCPLRVSGVDAVIKGTEPLR